MDINSNGEGPHQAQTDPIPLTKILGTIALCFILMSAILGLAVMWIIRVGKAEHAEKQRRLAKKEE
jgi:hypothetical protein